MKAPWALRWALAVAALTGDYNQIMVDSHRDGVRYVFDVAARPLKRWFERRETLRQMRKRTRREVAAEILTAFEDHAPQMTDKAMLDLIHERLHKIQQEGIS
jgi:hypothetical protein